MTDASAALAVVDWRRRVFALYATVRRTSRSDPAEAHRIWRDGRDELFATHAASPIPPDDRPVFSGLPVGDYDPAWRFEIDIAAPAQPHRLELPTGTDGIVPFELLGHMAVPDGGSLDVWRLASYGGGLFVPVKDASAGQPGGTYGGGRYLLDTVKGADLGTGASPGTVVIDFNFAYNPSCAYDPAWECPLAPPGNVLHVAVPVGERTWAAS